MANSIGMWNSDCVKTRLPVPCLVGKIVSMLQIKHSFFL